MREYGPEDAAADAQMLVAVFHAIELCGGLSVPLLHYLNEGNQHRPMPRSMTFTGLVYPHQEARRS